MIYENLNVGNSDTKVFGISRSASYNPVFDSLKK